MILQTGSKKIRENQTPVGKTKLNLRLERISCLTKATGSNELWAANTPQRVNRWNRSKRPPGIDHSLGFPLRNPTKCFEESSNRSERSEIVLFDSPLISSEKLKDVPDLDSPAGRLSVVHVQEQEEDVWNQPEHKSNNEQAETGDQYKKQLDPYHYVRSLNWNSLMTGDDPWAEKNVGILLKTNQVYSSTLFDGFLRMSALIPLFNLLCPMFGHKGFLGLHFKLKIFRIQKTVYVIFES